MGINREEDDEEGDRDSVAFDGQGGSASVARNGFHGAGAGGRGGYAGSVAGSAVTGITGFASHSLAPRHVSASVSLALAGLPQPRNTYELVAPPPADEEEAGEGGGPAAKRRRLGEEGDAGSSAAVRDRAELDAEAAEAAAAAEAEERRKLSAVLRHVPSLPRPLQLEEDPAAPPASRLLGQALAAAAAFPPYTGLPQAAAEDGAAAAPTAAQLQQHLSGPLRELAIADSIIREEALRLVKADGAKYPVS
jgi:hypothetical protein